MKTFTTFLTERFVSCFSPKDRMPYAKQAFKMLNDAYVYLGGLLGAKTFDEFVKNYVNEPEIKMWKMVKRGDKITAIRIYKDNNGRKTVAMASTPDEQGKKDISMICQEDYNLKDRHTWEEVSGKALTFALKKGAIVYPVAVAQELMPNKQLKAKEDGFFYTRKIKGSLHTKCLIGYPPKGEGIQLAPEEIDRFKKLAIQYEGEDEKANSETIEEGFFGIPSVEEIVWMLVKCILAWELIKMGAKFSISFVKGLFVSGSNELGAILGEKFRKKISGAVKETIKQNKIKKPLGEFISLKKELSKGSISEDVAKERIKTICKDIANIDDELFNSIVAECEKFTKDEQMVNKISKALNI